MTDISSILFFFKPKVGRALHVIGYTWRGRATEEVFGGLAASPDSCCKIERSQWDQGGGVQRPQSLNTNVLLMPHCEGQQEYK